LLAVDQIDLFIEPNYVAWSVEWVEQINSFIKVDDKINYCLSVCK